MRKQIGFKAFIGDKARVRHFLLGYMFPVMVLLIVGVGIVLAQWRFMRDGNRGFIIGQPSPQAYRALSPFSYDDNAATDELKGMARQSVAGVVLRDVSAKDRLNTRLRELRAVKNSSQLNNVNSESFNNNKALLNAIINLSDERRNIIFNAALRAGGAYIDKLGENNHGEVKVDETGALLWEEINKLRLSVEDANLVYQILAKLGELVFYFSDDLTDRVKNLVERDVPVVTRTLEIGDLIVDEGEVITPLTAGLLHLQGYVQDKFPTTQVVIALLWALVLPLWLEVLSSDSEERTSWLCVVFVIAICWLCETLAMCFNVPGAGVLPAVLTACLCISGPLAFAVSLTGTASGVTLINLPITSLLALLAISVITSTAGFFFLRKLDSREQLTRRVIALAIFLVGVRLIISWLQSGEWTFIMGGRFILVELSLSVIIGLFLPMIESYIDVLSILRLKELSYSSTPLLRDLQTLTPGTYQHCLTIANLIEAPARALGLDVNLMRAGAFYHDVGKLRHPQFFVENQGGGFNIHDDMTPSNSALTIINHVKSGVDVAIKNKLPRRIRDFIAEHHGTTCVRYFYNKAVAQAEATGKGEKIDWQAFCYPGPKPQSRETALLMITDSLEAAVRSTGLGQELQEHGSDATEAANAAHPNRGRAQTIKALEQIINQVITSKISEGQFDEVNFTMKDMTRVKEALLSALLSIYHTRRVKKIDRRSAKS